jgi:flagellar motor switch protein FliG
LGSQKAVDIINRLTFSPNPALRFYPPDRSDPSPELHPAGTPSDHRLDPGLPRTSQGLDHPLPAPPEKQSDVAKRIATMDRTTPDVLAGSGAGSGEKTLHPVHEDYTAAGGVESIVDILNLVDRHHRETPSSNPWKKKIRNWPKRSRNGCSSSRTSLCSTTRRSRESCGKWIQDELAKALKAVDNEVQDKIFRNMSKRAAALLKEDMDSWGRRGVKTWRKRSRRSWPVIRKAGRRRGQSSSPGPARKTSWSRTYRGILWRKMYSIPWKLSI